MEHQNPATQLVFVVPPQVPPEDGSESIFGALDPGVHDSDSELMTQE
jgi:hypothetical protein